PLGGLAARSRRLHRCACEPGRISRWRLEAEMKRTWPDSNERRWAVAVAIGAPRGTAVERGNRGNLSWPPSLTAAHSGNERTYRVGVTVRSGNLRHDHTRNERSLR